MSPSREASVEQSAAPAAHGYIREDEAVLTSAPSRSLEDGNATAGSPRRRKQEPTAAERVLRLLARREHTRRELEQKLKCRVSDVAELQRVLDDFAARGWLSEERAAAQLVRMARARFGAARIRQTLIEKGVPGHLVASSLDSLRDTELDTARAVWARKFKSAPADAAERARHVRFLQARGFSLEIAMRVVRGS